MTWVELTTYGSQKPTYVLAPCVLVIVGCEWGSTLYLAGGGSCSVQEDPDTVRERITQRMGLP